MKNSFSLPDWLVGRIDHLDCVAHFIVIHGEARIPFSMSSDHAHDYHAIMHIAVPFKKVLIEREKTALAVAQALSV